MDFLNYQGIMAPCVALTSLAGAFELHAPLIHHCQLLTVFLPIGQFPTISVLRVLDFLYR